SGAERAGCSGWPVPSSRTPRPALAAAGSSESRRATMCTGSSPLHCAARGSPLPERYIGSRWPCAPEEGGPRGPRPEARARRSRPAGARVQRAHSAIARRRSEEHTSELQSRFDLVCRLLLEKKKKKKNEQKHEAEDI